MSVQVDLLLGLPSELSSCVLGSWLEWKDVAKADSAYCHGSKRATFLALLALPTFDLFKHPNEASSPAFYSWALTSRVKGARMVAYRRASVYTNYADRFEAHVSSLTICSMGLAEPAQHAPEPYQLMRLCSNVSSISLKDCSLNPSFVPPLLQVLSNLPSIQKLTIGECFSWNPDDMDEKPTLVLDRPIALSKLNLSRDLASYILVSFLSKVSPAHLTDLEVDASNSRVQTILRAMLPQCVKLTSLCFSGELDDAPLVEFLDVCPHIEHLDLTCVRGLSDDGAFTIAHALSRLKSLNVVNCGYSNELLYELAEYRHDTLECLNIEHCYCGITSVGITHLLKHCRALHTLQVNPSQLMDLQAPYLGNLTTLKVSLAGNNSLDVKTFLSAIAPHGAKLQHLKIVAHEFGVWKIMALNKRNFAQLLSLHLVAGRLMAAADKQAVVKALYAQLPGVKIVAQFR